MIGIDENGGIYNYLNLSIYHYYLNLSIYHYGNNNPIKYIDPDGNAPGDRFDSIDSAAKDFGKIYNNDSIKNNKEYGSTIYKGQEISIDDKGNKKVNEYFYYSIPNKGNGDSAMPYTSPQNKNDELAGITHTHGAYDKKYKNNEFSGADKKVSDTFKVPIYVSTPNGSLQKYNNSKTSIIDTKMPSDPKDPTKYKKAPIFDDKANNQTQEYTNKKWNGKNFYNAGE